MAFDGNLFLRILRGIRQNNTSEVCRLLSEHARKNELPEDFTPLAIASSEEAGDVIVKFLIEKAGMDVNGSCKNSGITPLTLACRKGHVDIVKYLLQRPGIDPNKQAPNGITPLKAICSPLLQSEVYKENINTLTPLKTACVARPNIDEIVKLLLTNEETNPNPLSYDADNRIISTPLMMLITLQKFDLVSLILDNKRFKVDNLLKCGQTELHVVIMTDYSDKKLQFEHIKKLISAGADPTIRQDQRHFNHKDNCNAIEAAKDEGLSDIAGYLEKIRIEQSSDRFKELRAKSIDNGLDRTWQENQERIYDSLDGLVQYAAESRTSILAH